jgi:hypothetical protein
MKNSGGGEAYFCEKAVTVLREERTSAAANRNRVF